MFIIFLFETTSSASSQKLTNLTYDVTLNEDGSVNVKEIWQIRISETNTLFKTFELDQGKYGSIQEVKVSEITENGEKLALQDTKTYAYHVPKDCYYALKTNAKEFEIAWGVAIEDTKNKTYQIEYKIEDAIKTYDDCSEFYWQFIGKTNAIPAKKVEGRITLPQEISQKENLKVWAHGPLDGKIEIVDNQTVSFAVENLDTETMVEVRIVTLDPIFSENHHIVSRNQLESILAEETRWANEANARRTKFIVLILIIMTIRNWNCNFASFESQKIQKDIEEYDIIGSRGKDAIF